MNVKVTERSSAGIHHLLACELMRPSTELKIFDDSFILVNVSSRRRYFTKKDSRRPFRILCFNDFRVRKTAKGKRTFCQFVCNAKHTRAAVGMGIPMGIPMGMGMVWVWGL